MDWISLLFTGLWPLLWKFGLGFGLVAGGIAWWYFSPIFKKEGLFVAAAAAIWMSAYGLGVRDEHARIYKQAEVRTEQSVREALRTRELADAETRGPEPARSVIDRLLRRPKAADCYDRSQPC